MMLPWLLLSVLCVPHAAPPQPLELVSKGFSLVYGKVIDITVKKDDKREIQLSTFQITHVYCGDHKLKGQTFFLPLKTVFEQRMAGSGFGLVTPWVKEDEEGVWVVHNEKYNGKDWYQGKRGAALWECTYPLPARKGIGDPQVFKNAVTFAKTAETIDQAAERDKLGLLEKAVRAPDWGTAEWAVRVLCRNAPDRLVRMVRDQLAKDPPHPDRLRRLVEQLDDDHFKRREAATKELTRIGLDAVPVLCQAMAKAPSLESHRRMAGLLRDLDHRLRTRTAEHPAWTILRVISPYSENEKRVFRDLRDLAQKYPGSWLELEIHVRMKLSNKNRAGDFGRADHWNAQAEIYGEKCSEEKKRD